MKQLSKNHGLIISQQVCQMSLRHSPRTSNKQKMDRRATITFYSLHSENHDGLAERRRVTATSFTSQVNNKRLDTNHNSFDFDDDFHLSCGLVSQCPFPGLHTPE